MWCAGQYVFDSDPHPSWTKRSSTNPVYIDKDGVPRRMDDPQPQQWEYVVKYPHEETENTNCHGLTEWANDLGADEWELVAVAEGGKWVFKRPKRGDARMGIMEVNVAVDDIVGSLGNCIFVWRFADAPPEYKELSPHGGDEDWLALICKEHGDSIPPWMESGTPFGGSAVSQHEVSDGIVCIGAHA